MAKAEEMFRLWLSAPEERQTAALSALRGELDDSKTSVVEKYLTATELARMLGFSVMSVWRWQLPAHRLGGKPRYLISEVRTYLDSDEFKAVAEQLRRERRSAYRKSKKAS